MKNILFVALFPLLFGCTEITYREPQPKGVKSLSSVPKDLMGRYPLPEDDGSVKDTLIIQSTGYYFTDDDDKGNLGDKLVLKQYKGYYFINVKDDPQWFLRILKRDKDGSITIMSMESENAKFNSLLKDLSQEIKIDSVILSEDKLYLIDPSPKELMGLIKKGYFKKGPVIRKIKE
ncbi:MAG TPA: hypothetical protein VGK59_11830 [Ohtaekwangia sp.]